MPRLKKSKISKTPGSIILANRQSFLLGALIVAGLIVGVSRLSQHKPTTGLVPAISTGPSATVQSEKNNVLNITPTPQTDKNTVIAKLPFTKSEALTYTIKDNDSLAKLGITFCNDKRGYLYLEEQNNLIEPYTLHPGNTISISCPSDTLMCENKSPLEL